MSRRRWLTTTTGALGLFRLGRPPSSDGGELTVPAGASENRFDFEAAGIERWTVVTGQWIVEDMEGAPSGKKALV